MRGLGVIAGAVMTGLMAMGGPVFALDVADVVREWTPEGKKLATERAKLPTHDEMVLIPAGSFIMGSDRKIDRNAYPAEFPQRKV
ncbi:MAG: formylglycine-generating enzyme family protein, partial [Nitrospiraceae bacterium]